MRLLQQVAAMLATIMAKRRLGQVAEAGQEVEAACLRTVGLPLTKVRHLSPEELSSWLQTAGALRYTRSVMLAELLIQDAEILETKNESQQALASYIHAFCLLCDSFNVLSVEEQAVYESKLQMLAEKLDHLPANPYTTQRLLTYRQRHNAKPCAPPNGGPAESPGSSGASSGPPLVS